VRDAVPSTAPSEQLDSPNHPSRPWRADTRRSLSLLRSFRYEQSDPDRFYHHLGWDSVEQVAQYAALRGALVVDVGGGPGHPRAAFTARGARYLFFEPDRAELLSRGQPPPGSALADGLALPVRTACADVCFSINVLEHVARPEAFASEMLRVTRPGGIVFLSYTNWLSPNGGHETGPYHLVLGARRAAALFERRHGRRPKHEFGVSLFPLSAARMLRWAEDVCSQGQAEIIDRLPKYHPAWTHWIINVPGLREVASWNVLIVLRRRTC